MWLIPCIIIVSLNIFSSGGVGVANDMDGIISSSARHLQLEAQSCTYTLGSFVGLLRVLLDQCVLR